MKDKGDQFLDVADMGKPTQLPMFMRAGDFKSSLTATADMPVNSVDEVYDMKLNDSMRPQSSGSHGAGVFESVQDKGVVAPVQMIHGDKDLMLGDGHHRAAAADFASSLPGTKDPDQWMPVIHTDARSGSKHMEQDDTGDGLFDPEVRRSAVFESAQFSQNTGRYYRSMSPGQWDK